MGKVLKLIDPSARIVLSGGRGDINNGTPQAVIKKLLEDNPNYASQFHEVEEDEKPVAKSSKTEDKEK
jgi:hypothetical protein